MPENLYPVPEGDDPILDELIDIEDLKGTTLRQCREMAVATREADAQTPVEVGLAICIIYLIDRLAGQGRHTTEDVLAAVNRAADDILEAIDAGDEGVRDALNLMVNATMAYLTGEADDLKKVVETGYSADLDTVLGWIAAGVR